MQKNIINSSEPKHASISSESLTFDESFKQLEGVAASLSNSLDNTSEQIRKLEKRLIELKTNFPFEMVVCKEEVSQLLPLEDHHLSIQHLAPGYRTQIFWFLSWEPDSISKTYRLFLRCQKEELGYDKCIEKEVRLNVVILFKKPFLETKLEVRLKYSKYMIPFMQFFKRALDDYKTAIQNQEVFNPDIISSNNPLGVTHSSVSPEEDGVLAKEAIDEMRPLELEILRQIEEIKKKPKKSPNAVE